MQQGNSPPSPWVWLLLIVTTLMGGCTVLSDIERQLVFRPIVGESRSYAGPPKNTNEVWIPSGAAVLHAWWVTTGKAHNAAPAPVLLYLHGQRWNLSGHADRIARLHELGFDILAIDYQGFGRSSAALPSESSVVSDAHAAWKWLLPQLEPAQPIYIYGHSLGAAIAVQLATDLSVSERVAGLILDSAFTSMPDAAGQLPGLGWLPIHGLMTQRFDSVATINQVTVPILFLHGSNDTVVPIKLGRALYDAAVGSRQWVVIDGAGHSDTLLSTGKEPRKALRAFANLVKPTDAHPKKLCGVPDARATMRPRRAVSPTLPTQVLKT